MWIEILIFIIVIVLIGVFIAIQRSIYYHPTIVVNHEITSNTDLEKLTYGESFWMRCPGYVTSFNGEADKWIRSIAIECSDGSSHDAGLERGIALPQQTPKGQYTKLDIYYDKENINAIDFYDTTGKEYTWGNKKFIGSENYIRKQPGTDCQGPIRGLKGTKTIDGIAQLGVIC